MKKDLELKGRRAKPPARLLLVDDIPQMLSSTAQFLRAEGYRVDTAVDGLQALRLLAAQRYNLVVTEVNLARTNILKLLWSIRRQWRNTLVLVMTDYGTMARALEALEMGAFEFLVKPIIDDELRVTIQKALQQQTLLSENHLLRRKLGLRLTDSWRRRRQSAYRQAGL